MDSPVSPGARGSTNFLSGVTDDMKQKYRDRLRSVTVDQIKSVAER